MNRPTLGVSVYQVSKNLWSSHGILDMTDNWGTFILFYESTLITVAQDDIHGLASCKSVSARQIPTETVYIT